MPTIDEKLNAFDKIIVEDAMRARDLIRNQIHQESEQRLAEIKAGIKRDAEREVQREARRAEMEKDSRISKAGAEARKMLINARNEILASVLVDLEERLSAFTRTEAYDGYIIKNIMEALKYANIKGDGGGNGSGGNGSGVGFVLYMTPRDCEKYKSAALTCAPDITVAQAEAGMIGGVRISNDDAGVFVDNTLKKKVELCADELFLMSGLTVDRNNPTVHEG